MELCLVQLLAGILRAECPHFGAVSALVTLRVASAYVAHIRRVRQSREPELPAAVTNDQLELAVEAAQQLQLAPETDVATGAAPAEAAGVAAAGSAVGDKRQLRQQGLGTVGPERRATI